MPGASRHAACTDSALAEVYTSDVVWMDWPQEGTLLAESRSS